MKIPVLGMDPSLRNWGLAVGQLDLTTGILDDIDLSLICPKDLEGKQVRNNSNDMHLAHELASAVIPLAHKAKVIFVEVPVGSQSARAMASYGIVVGVLGAIRSLNIPLIEVTALEVKLAFTGNKHATKNAMIEQGLEFYPNVNWPVHEKNGKSYLKGEVTSKAEHVADALGAIHSGVNTPTFQNLLRLFNHV